VNPFTSTVRILPEFQCRAGAGSERLGECLDSNRWFSPLRASCQERM